MTVSRVAGSVGRFEASMRSRLVGSVGGWGGARVLIPQIAMLGKTIANVCSRSC